MHNFLNPKLFPKAVCKSPCLDNYEIENIISEDYTKKCRGFLAYSSIKPPVDVDFEFICSVNIYYIKINSSVGSQKCTGIELLIKSSDTYTTVAKALFEKAGVVFCNSRFYSKEKPPCDLQDYHLAFFSSNLFRLFLNAKGVRLRIFRTYKSVPCLSSVEVWGKVSKLCSATTKETVEKLVNKINVKPGSNTVKDKDEIPEDFRDDLTNEIMTIPMTLPSGKTVDQTTLEKYNLNEKEFGRKPGDPFTGLKFSDKLKPILNVALKSRIDMYLLQNSDKPEFFNLKRTLGRSSVSVNPSTSISYKKIKLDKSDDGLERAINLVKTNTNFVSFTSEEEKSIKCVKCGKVGEYFYKAPCQHLFCRNCLLLICKKMECGECRTEFNKSHITKVNL
ncbi:unnamed protein product [Brassicogethes aeneus]|uniref:U-box domain-containing protein n=1 Tax=Brassicogethes aeneus TaxID=1431903 RepID=A0A9P0B6V3_BRAAE|nr:unnamed protein product [Brassicogethes aeneus]